MAAPGHADDCTACAHVGRESATSGHTRMEPPAQPQESIEQLLFMCGGICVFLISLLIGDPVAVVFGMIGAAVGLYLGFQHKQRTQAQMRGWEAEHEAWLATQTQVWAEQRARGELWPCPTCGSPSCANEHSEAETVVIRAGLARYAEPAVSDR